MKGTVIEFTVPFLILHGQVAAGDLMDVEPHKLDVPPNLRGCSKR